jgi:hypothetical protein
MLAERSCAARTARRQYWDTKIIGQVPCLPGHGAALRGHRGQSADRLSGARPENGNGPADRKPTIRTRLFGQDFRSQRGRTAEIAPTALWPFLRCQKSSQQSGARCSCRSSARAHCSSARAGCRRGPKAGHSSPASTPEWKANTASFRSEVRLPDPSIGAIPLSFRSAQGGGHAGSGGGARSCARGGRAPQMGGIQPFEFITSAEIELVCRFKAATCQVCFDLDSLRLLRLK